MKFKVFQIDAWRNPDKTWQYNNWFEIDEVEIKGEPTHRKLLKALRQKSLLYPQRPYLVDDYFSYEGTWSIQLRNGMPIYDLVEVK